MISVLTRDRLGRLNTPRTEGGNMTMEAKNELCSHEPKAASSYLKLEEAKNGFSPRALDSGPALLISDF